MAEGKKAFVLYTDWKKYADGLTDAQLGKWTRWMFEYCNDKWKGKDEEITYPSDKTVKMLCMMTKDILKRDLKKYEAKRERILQNGKQYQDKTDIETDIDTENGNEIETDIKTVISNKLLVNSNKLLKENNTPNRSVKEKTPQSRFSPPTLEEVKAYCEERRNLVDPERFYNFYASKGWMVGKNKMKDWKAAIRGTWEQEAGFKPDENDDGGFMEL